MRRQTRARSIFSFVLAALGGCLACSTDGASAPPEVSGGAPGQGGTAGSTSSKGGAQSGNGGQAPGGGGASAGASTGGSAGSASGGVSSADGWLQVYPAPGGIAPSEEYEVTLIQGGNRYELFVYETRPKADRGHTDQDGGNEFRENWEYDGAPYRSFSWATFAFQGKVTVEVRVKNTTVNTAIVRPSRFAIPVERVDEKTVRFELTEPGSKVSVEFNDTTDDALLLFADPPEPLDTLLDPGTPDTFVASAGSVDVPEGTKRVYFGPGVYDLGRWHAPSSVEHVYIAGGAFVYGSLDIDGRDRFSLSGRGILSGGKFVFRANRDTLEHMSGDSEKECWSQCLKLVELWSVKDATIDGVTLIESPYYYLYPQGSTKLSMRRFKILGSWTWNTDGPELTTGGIVEDCFAQTNDDMFKLYHSDAIVRNCVAWHMHNGGMFQMGWTTKSFSNVAVSDIDLIHAEWRWSDNWNNGIVNHAADPSGVFQPSGSGTIEDVHFSNVRAEGTILRALGLYVFQGMTLKNFRIDNLSVERFGGDISPKNSIRNEIVGFDGGRIEDIAFTNLTVGGELVTSENATSLGKFVIDGGSTSNVSFGP